MPSDRLGRELKPGDAVCLRGRIKAILTPELGTKITLVEIVPDVPFSGGSTTTFLEPGQVRYIDDEEEE